MDKDDGKEDGRGQWTRTMARKTDDDDGRGQWTRTTARKTDEDDGEDNDNDSKRQ